jgi:hypothetical protein
MGREPLAISLKEAGELLSIKDTRTIIKYGKEGRLRIVGTGNGQKVVVASIHEYLNGESEWHRSRHRSSAQMETPATTISFHPRTPRKRRSKANTEQPDTTISLKPVKLWQRRKPYS